VRPESKLMAANGTIFIVMLVSFNYLFIVSRSIRHRISRSIWGPTKCQPYCHFFCLIACTPINPPLRASLWCIKSRTRPTEMGTSLPFCNHTASPTKHSLSRGNERPSVKSVICVWYAIPNKFIIRSNNTLSAVTISQ
jgi:hypothetical protein